MASGLLLGPWIFDADGDGAPFVGGLLTTYVNGTTTPQATYTTTTLTTPLPNPIVANADGRFPDIWADTSKTFSIKWEEPDGTDIATYDGRVPLGPSDSSAFALVDLSNVSAANGLTAGAAWGLTGQGFRNRVINGEMLVNRRTDGSQVPLATVGRTYAFDRFSGRTIAAGGAATLQRSTGGPTAFPNCAIYSQTTGATAAASDQAFIETIVEGSHIGDAMLGASGAQYLAVRFWAQSSVAGKYSAYVQNADRSRSYVVNFTTLAATSWQEFTFIIAGDQAGTWVSDTGPGLILGWDAGSGSNYEGAAGAWAGSDRRRTSDSIKTSGGSGRTLSVAGVQIAVMTASLQPPFERRPLGLETVLCARYYKPVPGSQASDGTGLVGSKAGTAAIQIPVSFDTPTRVAPILATNTPTFSSSAAPTTTSAIAYFDTAINAFVAITGALGINVTRASTSGLLLTLTAATSFTGTAGAVGSLVLGTAARLGFDADYT